MINLTDSAKKTLHNLINLECLNEKNENEKKKIVKGVLAKIETTGLIPINEYIIEKIKSEVENNKFTIDINYSLSENQTLNSTKDNSISNNIDFISNETNFTDENYLYDKIIDIIYQKIVDIKHYPGDTLSQREYVLVEWIKNILPNVFNDFEE